MMIRGSLGTVSFQIVTHNDGSDRKRLPGWYFLNVYNGLAQGSACGPYSTAGKALDAAFGSQLPTFSEVDKAKKEAANFEAFKKKLDALEATLADIKKIQIDRISAEEV